MLLQKNIVKKYLNLLTEEQMAKPWAQYQDYFLNEDIQANIHKIKEEQFQEGFLRELFVKVLGYTINPSPNYNLTTELKNEVGSKKADGAILIDDKVIGVIELKDHKTPDLASIENQAFGYKNQHRNTRIVIISNFEKLRFYIDNTVEFREWDIFHMTKDEFRELYLCLAWTQVERGVALQMKEESVSTEDQITNALYKDYSQFKRVLFADIVAQNPSPEGKDEKEWQLLLFKKTQKLLDRLLFIFFAEDGKLLEPNSMVRIISLWNTLKDADAYVPLYDRIKQYFGYLDTGHQGKPFDVYAYNGGLFKPDAVLDSLSISDELLAEHTLKLSAYDFESDVDVNILGHIFENSLSEIEEVTQQINNGATPQTSKRKQDGVFYTPQYITKYIVENTVGRLCAEKKQELHIVEDEYFSDQRRQLQTKKRLLDQLQQYRKWLLEITILDPACGSGAFLNAALQFLMAEHKHLDEMEKKISKFSLPFEGVENYILENNLYGVDINEESVGIAQSALWLRTAKPYRKLNSLNQNIKCGNSLISDPAVAGDKAFNWQEQFPKVFEKGGFDVVIGNPPYVNINTQPQNHEYFKSQYSEIHTGYNDLMYYFLYKGIKLLKADGLMGMITSNYYLGNEYAKKLRLFLNGHVERIIDFHNEMIFLDANVHTSIIFASNRINLPYIEIFQNKRDNSNCEINLQNNFTRCNLIRKDMGDMWIIANQDASDIIKKMQAGSVHLEDITIIEKGSTSGKNDVFTVSCEFARANKFEDDIIRKNIKNGDIHSYLITDRGNLMIYTDNETQIDRYPNIHKYLLSHKKELLQRNEVKKGVYEWYRLERPRNKQVFDAKEKIVVPYRAEHNRFAYDNNQYFNDGGDIRAIVISNENYSIKYLLVLLNSKLLDWYYGFIGKTKGAAREYFNKPLAEIPIPNIEKSYQQPFIALADSMLSLNSQLQEKRSQFLRGVTNNLEGVKITTALQQFDQMNFVGFMKELKKQKITIPLKQQNEWEDFFNDFVAECQELSAQIKATDEEIDNKVFDLYGLTEEERKIVMEA